jgi:hypothetical protein
MMLSELRQLLLACSADADLETYRSAAVQENALSKRSVPARERSFRYLRELYSLDLRQDSFAALRKLWDVDAEAQPLIALLAAIDRDPSLRATAKPIIASRPGERVNSHDLRTAVQAVYPDSYSAGTSSKIGRNALSSWTQSGHLAAVTRTERTRRQATCRPTAVAFALFLGHRAGSAGQALFDTLYAQLLDISTPAARDQAFEAAQRGWIDYREVGGIVDVGFTALPAGTG